MLRIVGVAGVPELADDDRIDVERQRAHDEAGRFEQWERNYAALLGLGQATQEAIDLGLDAIAERVVGLAERLRARLVEEIPGVTVHDLGRNRCGIVTFSIAGVDLAPVKAALYDAAINISLVPPASALIDTRTRNLPPMLRASVHYYNTDEEFDRFLGELTRILG